METDHTLIVFVMSLVALFGLLAGFILYIIFRYRQRQAEHLQEKQLLLLQFEQESAQVQVELQDQLMNRISQELHDNIGQALTLTMLQLRNVDSNDTHQSVSEAIETIARANDDVRHLSKTLNENFILDMGLEAALERDFEIIRSTKTVNITNCFEMPENALKPKVELLLYRCVQEVMNNALKHSKATDLSVELKEEHGLLTIRVADNGVGVDPSKLTLAKGLGMKSLKQRIDVLQGKLEIKSALGAGTTIIIKIPSREIFVASGHVANNEL